MEMLAKALVPLVMIILIGISISFMFEQYREGKMSTRVISVLLTLEVIALISYVLLFVI